MNFPHHIVPATILFAFAAAGCQTSTPAQAETTPAKLAEAPDVQKVTEPVSEPELGGYCPVALVESGKLIQGLPGLQFRYNGKVYQMANDAAARQFLASPSVYAPPFSTHDPVNFSETGERTRGSLNLFTVRDKKAWFFVNEENRRKFLSGPQPFIENAVGTTPAGAGPNP